ncbi:hypothetical protein ACNOYE_26740 [Nannocystaceae bacterium ST9]
MARRPTSILSLALLLTSPLACKVEDTPGGDEVGDTSTGESTDTTTTDTTESESTESSGSDEGDFIPGDTTDTTETGDPPEPKTCREMLDCVFMCLGDLGLECLQTCGEGFDPAEVQKAGALVLCLGQVCADKDQCSLADLTNPTCVGCIGLGLFLPEPPGCEEQAMACQ